jgi:hypothetical protein
VMVKAAHKVRTTGKLRRQTIDLLSM